VKQRHILLILPALLSVITFLDRLWHRRRAQIQDDLGISPEGWSCRHTTERAPHSGAPLKLPRQAAG
jgi:hypothetical protein